MRLAQSSAILHIIEAIWISLITEYFGDDVTTREAIATYLTLRSIAMILLFSLHDNSLNEVTDLMEKDEYVTLKRYGILYVWHKTLFEFVMLIALLYVFLSMQTHPLICNGIFRAYAVMAQFDLLMLASQERS